MSVLSVAPYFPFAGVLPVRQSVQQVGTSTHSLITFATNQATRPACSGCGQRVEPIHSYHVRRVRDLSLAQARVDLDIPHRKVRCPDCGIRIEAHVFLDPFRRSTRRFEQAVEDLCRYLPIKQVAEHFGLSWHTVKEIDKRRLLREVGTPCYDGLRLLAIDEISVHKGHRYMTTVLDFETGHLVWMGEDRSKKTIERFLGELSDDQLASIEAFALDMSGAYRHALQQMCSHAALVYDCFHVVARYGREVIDRVRLDESKKQSEAGRRYIKGSRYLLLRNEDLAFPVSALYPVLYGYRQYYQGLFVRAGCTGFVGRGAVLRIVIILSAGPLLLGLMGPNGARLGVSLAVIGLVAEDIFLQLMARRRVLHMIEEAVA